MAQYIFPAIFEPENGMYDVSFPDLPSCYTCGSDLNDAIHMAEDALCGCLSRAEEKGEVIPTASDVASLRYPSDSLAMLLTADTDKQCHCFD